MGHTQITTIARDTKVLDKSLDEIDTDRVVFVTEKKDLKKTLGLRNRFALKHKLPTETRTILDMNKVAETIAHYENPVLHIIEHHFINYPLMNAAFVLGIPVFVSNGRGLEKITGLEFKFRDLLSENQQKIISTLAEKQMSIKQLAHTLDIEERVIFYYLHGKQSLKGLVNLGIVTQENDLLKITPVGRMIACS
ncbi:MAG: hypothetical protein J4432_03250 [DPANN group archaeon]|nr:hypothetical protein [DPANN group archaeon]